MVEGDAGFGINGLPGAIPSTMAWFCLRSRPKTEHIAAAHLRQDGIETFLPRIRLKRSTRRGPVWFTEALFPNYLFARFDWMDSLRQIYYSRGVAGVVHFGDRWPTIPDAIIDDLRATFGEDELHVISTEIEPGDSIKISGGTFHGLQAVVSTVMPNRERVRVLLEFLGRQSTVELRMDAVIKEKDDRKAIL